MSDRRSSEARLERLLYILAAASHAGGATLDELSSALGVSAQEILRDIEEATARAYYHPAGTVDKFQILVEGDRVCVWSPDEFRRPARFSAPETLALGLGLRMLAAESDEPRRQKILALARRLERDLAGPATDGGADINAHAVAESASPAPYEIELGDDGFRGAVADAAHRRCRCRILYLKPGDDSPSERLIEPRALVYARGSWYILARDVGRDANRVFRMDRVLEAEATQDRFDAPEDLDASGFLADGGSPFEFDEHQVATVRYAPAVARWVVESTKATLEPDGSVVVRYPVADPRWIVRHVLQYGGEAELVSPPELREMVYKAARRAADEGQHPTSRRTS